MTLLRKEYSGIYAEKGNPDSLYPVITLLGFHNMIPTSNPAKDGDVMVRFAPFTAAPLPHCAYQIEMLLGQTGPGKKPRYYSMSLDTAQMREIAAMLLAQADKLDEKYPDRVKHIQSNSITGY